MKLSSYPLTRFERAYKVEDDVRVRERLQILLYLREGYTQREVANIIRVSKGKVLFWKDRFESGGFDGLYDKDGRGRKAALSEEELSMLASSVADGYRMKNGYARPYKTKDVSQFLTYNFQAQYTLRHTRRILRKINFSIKVPRPRHKRRNQKEVDEFKRAFKKNKKN